MNKRPAWSRDHRHDHHQEATRDLAILLAAQVRGWSIRALSSPTSTCAICRACGCARALTVRDDRQDWYTLGEPQDEPLAGLGTCC